MNERSQWNEMELKWSQHRRVFAYNIALYVVSNSDDHDLKSIKVIDNENIYKWKETISSEIKLASQSRLCLDS